MSSKGITVDTVIGAACWASYLINGDSTGLDEREQALADAWCSALAPSYVVSCEGEPWFSNEYALHTGDNRYTGGEVIEYITHTKGASNE